MKRISLLVLAFAILAMPGVGLAKSKPPKANKCQPHNAAYAVAGTLVSGTLAPGTRKHTYTGTLVVHVTKASKHAKSAKGTDQTYTLTNAHLKLHGENPAALTMGSRVKLNGSITTLAKKCDQTGFTPTVTIKRGSIKAPKSHKH